MSRLDKVQQSIRGMHAEYVCSLLLKSVPESENVWCQPIGCMDCPFFDSKFHSLSEKDVKCLD